MTRLGLTNCIPEGWTLDPMGKTIRVIAPRQKEIYPFLSMWFHEVREAANHFGKVIEVCSRDSKRSTSIKPCVAAQPTRGAASPMNQYAQTGIFPILHIAEQSLPLTPGVRSALDRIAENSRERWALHRISADMNTMTQIAMTESCQILIKSATVKQALNRDRREYMHLPDLEDLKREIRQRLEPGNRQSVLQVRWKGFDPVTRASWREFAWDYSIVDIVDGFIYQLGRSPDVPTPIEAPAMVR